MTRRNVADHAGEQVVRRLLFLRFMTKKNQKKPLVLVRATVASLTANTLLMIAGGRPPAATGSCKWDEC